MGVNSGGIRVENGENLKENEEKIFDGNREGS
jgi:hypothetical protein